MKAKVNKTPLKNLVFLATEVFKKILTHTKKIKLGIEAMCHQMVLHLKTNSSCFYLKKTNKPENQLLVQRTTLTKTTCNKWAAF